MPYTKVSCVYGIRNLINKKFYVGITVDFKRRKIRHFSELRCGTHPSSHLQNAFRIYGEHNFIMKPIEFVGIEELVTREKYWISRLRSWSPTYGYNLRAPEAGARNSGSRVLTEIDVLSIRYALRTDYKTIFALAKEYNVAPQTISNIKVGNTWKEVGDSTPITTNRQHRFTEEVVQTIRQFFEQSSNKGEAFMTICKEYDLTYSHLRRILNRQRWSERVGDRKCLAA